MKYLHVASTVLLAVSLSSTAALPAPTADAPQTEAMTIPYASYASERARSTWFPETLSLLREAQALEKQGKAEEALERYRDAWRLEPFTNTYAELGIAEARAGHMLACARNLQIALQGWTLHANTVRPVALIREVFAYCKKDLGALAIKINVPDVRVNIDGEDVKEWPYFSELYVEPGKHAVKAMKDGYWMNQTFVEVGPGEQKPLSIAMQLKYEGHYVGFVKPLTVNFHANLSTTAAKDEPPTWPKSLMVASGVGMGLGVGAAGIGFGLASKGDGSADTWYAVGAVGCGLVGLSLTGLIIGLASRPEPPPPNVIITPQIAKDGGGVSLTSVLP